MANYNFDQDKAVSLVTHMQTLEESVGKFAKVGITRIKECGLEGGQQGAKLQELTEQLELKFAEAEDFLKSQYDGLESLITNIGHFDMQTILDRAAEQVASIERAEKVQSKKVDFA